MNLSNVMGTDNVTMANRGGASTISFGVRRGVFAYVRSALRLASVGAALSLAATTHTSPAAAQCFGGYETGIWHNTQGDSPYEIEVVPNGCPGESPAPFLISVREHQSDGQLFLRGTFPAAFDTGDTGWIVVSPYSDGGYVEHPRLHVEGNRLRVTIFYESLDSKPSATVTQMFARWDASVSGLNDPLVLPTAPAPARFISAALDENGAEMTYVFRAGRYGAYHWDIDQLTATGLLSQLISAPPVEFQNGFDTALSGWGAFSGKSYFFKDSTYFRYDWPSGQVDSIAPIEDWGFPAGFNADLDAAFNGVGEYEGKAYFFRGSQYIRFDWATGAVDPGFPRFISAEWNLPAPFDSGVDAAVNGRGAYEGKTYFFKGSQYVRYDWAANAVDTGYPRDSASNWVALAPL